jgi:hypothetical protein
MGGAMQERFVASTVSKSWKLLAAMAVAASLSACAGDDWGGDPGAKPLAAGQTCSTIRAELDRLDAKGTQGKVEAATQGKKLPPAQMVDVNRYNELLNQYLGARCHVPPS